ncbi:hypothetical protein ACJ41O_013299 [Fusarium nematophilum]
MAGNRKQPAAGSKRGRKPRAKKQESARTRELETPADPISSSHGEGLSPATAEVRDATGGTGTGSSTSGTNLGPVDASSKATTDENALQLASLISEPSRTDEPQLAKFPISNLSTAEQEIAQLLLKPDLIDWEPYSPPEGHALKEAPAREDLSWGVRWVILKMLNNKHRFAKAITQMLLLTRQQVQYFLDLYLRTFYEWKTWEDIISQIPYQALLEHALTRRVSVPQLLSENRPSIHTDSIPEEDKERGVKYLEGRGMRHWVGEFEMWCSEQRMDFLPLQIEWEIIQDSIDKQLIQQGVERGWLETSVIGRALAPVRNASALDAAMRSDPQSIPFLGTVCDNIPRPPSESGSTGTQDEEGTRPTSPEADEGDRQTPDPDASGSPPPSSIPLIPGPLGRQPTPMQRTMLSEAAQRTFPDAYRYVSGDAVTTLVEEGRPPIPHHGAFRPQGVYLYTRPRLPVDNGSEGHERVQEKTESAAQKRSRTRSAFAGLLSGVDVYPRGPAQGEALVSQETVESLLGQASGGGRSDDMPDVLAETWMRQHEVFHQQQQPVQVFGDFIDAPSSTNFREMFDTASPYTNTSVKAQPAHTPKNPSDELRQQLKTKYSGYLKKKKSAPIRKPGGAVRNQSLGDLYDEDEEEEYLDDFHLPKPEKDLGYHPKKGALKKKASQRKGTARPRQKKQALTAQQDDQVDRGQAVVETASRMTRSQDAAIPEAASAPVSSTSSSSSAAPSSSGRIRIKLRSSQAGSSPAIPPMPDDPPAAPSSPVDGPGKNLEPIFGIARHQPLTGARTRVQRAHYAWSAASANFAAISTRARFAQTADRVVKPKGKSVAVDLPGELDELQRLREVFDGIEGAQQAQGAQDADNAEFAGCADAAVYAVQAEEACFAVEVKGKGEEDADGDAVMEDAEN